MICWRTNQPPLEPNFFSECGRFTVIWYAVEGHRPGWVGFDIQGEVESPTFDLPDAGRVWCEARAAELVTVTTSGGDVLAVPETELPPF